MILIIDNYDSFTFNLVQYLGEVSPVEVLVKRNDALSCEDISALKPAGIIISPGPCTPNKAGVSLELLKTLAFQFPILGVCLGHQAIGQAFGGRVVRAAVPMHGKSSEIFHDGKGLFKDVPSPFSATRYHSLVVEKSSLPECLDVSAWTEDGIIMGLRHRELPWVQGVQFHPESIMTRPGRKLLSQFVASCLNR